MSILQSRISSGEGACRRTNRRYVCASNGFPRGAFIPLLSSFIPRRSVRPGRDCVLPGESTADRFRVGSGRILPPRKENALARSLARSPAPAPNKTSVSLVFRAELFWEYEVAIINTSIFHRCRCFLLFTLEVFFFSV